MRDHRSSQLPLPDFLQANPAARVGLLVAENMGLQQQLDLVLRRPVSDLRDQRIRDAQIQSLQARLETNQAAILAGRIRVQESRVASFTHIKHPDRALKKVLRGLTHNLNALHRDCHGRLPRSSRSATGTTRLSRQAG